MRKLALALGAVVIVGVTTAFAAGFGDRQETRPVPPYRHDQPKPDADCRGG